MIIGWLASPLLMMFQGTLGPPLCGPGASVYNPLCQPSSLPLPKDVGTQLPLYNVEVLLEDGGKPDTRPEVKYLPCIAQGTSREAAAATPCWAVVTLKGFREVNKPLSSRGKNVVILSRLGAEGDVFAQNVVSVSQLALPAAAHRAYAKGEASAGLERWSEAEGHFREAVKVAPGMALAWDELGWTLDRQGNQSGAREAYRKAIAADPKLARPYVHLAGLSILDRNWEEAATFTEHALRLQPVNLPRADFYSAMAQFNLGHLMGAETGARRTIAADPNHAFPLAEYILAMALLKKSENAAARDHLQTYLNFEPRGPFASAARQVLAQLDAAAARK